MMRSASALSLLVVAGLSGRALADANAVEVTSSAAAPVVAAAGAPCWQSFTSGPCLAKGDCTWHDLRGKSNVHHQDHTSGSHQKQWRDGVCLPKACPLAPEYLGDGYCHDAMFQLPINPNGPECEFDAGDCCEASCHEKWDVCAGDFTSSTTWGYYCRDPKYVSDPKYVWSGCYAAPDCSVWPERCELRNGKCVPKKCQVGIPGWLGDGFCDKDGGYNDWECEFDAGDCCEASCQPGREYPCGSIGAGNDSKGYICKDPNAFPGCHAAPDCSVWPQRCALRNGKCVPKECHVEKPEWLGNGFCNSKEYVGYNTPECEFDGGDCCETSCRPGPEHACGSTLLDGLLGGYDCKDPNPTGSEGVTSDGDGYAGGVRAALRRGGKGDATAATTESS